MSITAGEPSAAGAALIAVGAASGMALFSAVGGSLIGAGISIALLGGQLPNFSSQARRFLVSVGSGPIITLTIMELTNWRIGAYTISAIAMLISFLSWKIFTSLHSRSEKIIEKTLDKALGRTLGIDCDDEPASVDGGNVDSGRANHWAAGRKLDTAHNKETNTADNGSANDG